MEEETYVEKINKKDKNYKMYVKHYNGDEITHKYYKSKVDLNNVSPNKIEQEKLLTENPSFFQKGTYYPTAIEAILSKHGYDPQIWVDVDFTFDKEFPKSKEELGDIRRKYDEIEENNEILNKYKDVNEDYLTQEEKDTIEKIKDELNFKKLIEEHNVLIDKMQRVEANIDNLVSKVEGIKAEENEANKTAGIMTILAIVYAVITTYLTCKLIPIVNELVTDAFEVGGIIMAIVIGGILLLWYIDFLSSKAIFEITYDRVGGFAYIVMILGAIFGPLIIFYASVKSGKRINYTFGRISDEEFNKMTPWQVESELNRQNVLRKMNNKK